MNRQTTPELIDESLDVRDRQVLVSTINSIGKIISKEYLYQLEKYEVYPFPKEWENIDINNSACLYKIKKIVSDSDESMIDKLVTVFSAAYTCKATVISIITSNGKSVQYYIGTMDKGLNANINATGMGQILYDTLKGNFPGIVIDNKTALKEEALNNLSETVFSNKYLSSISGIASLRKENTTEIKQYVQGIEHLVDSLQGKSYSIILVADPVSADELTVTKKAYEELSTTLSPYLSSNISLNEAETLSETLTESHSITETITDSEGSSENYNRTEGSSKTYTQGTGKTKDGANVGKIFGTILGAAAGAVATIATGGAAAPLVAAVALGGGAIGGSAGSTVGGLFGSKSKNSSNSEGTNSSVTQGYGKNKNHSVATGNNDGYSKGNTQGDTKGRTLQFNIENKTVKNLIQKIDKNLERIQKCESYGVFDCATYVLSTDDETVSVVSNSYNALMRGEKSFLQASHINQWNQDDHNTTKIIEYLKRFRHPIFLTNDSGIQVTPASMISSDELAINIGLPKKSISGLPVVETASFGRDVINVDGDSMGTVTIGKIYHMNQEECGNVNLEEKALCSHLFITGSTGSGKSNTVYQLLNSIKKTHSFMVIEPAKGEYKDIFGHDNDVFVYGTNPKMLHLLRINPFRFPDNVHVYEHMERLVDIFNVCWPMYAAMPAVLKASIEKAYLSAGWDLKKSVNTTGINIYPTFSDIANEVRQYINKSEYSDENKGNYKGALLTRLESLTNGVNGMIFTSEDISDSDLFDRKVIIDLSRLGSTETKSLIMGLLIIRMQEYRSGTSEKNNSFKHMTVLEEAHCLLKRTSTEQNSESSNLTGKSVEMLANSIAEMRTYGEAFVIVDQAPGLLDMSVIRNTNTKIIHRLPDYSDRELVGKSANLNDDQISELAKLRTGVAAVYQNNWLSPVLCAMEELKLSNMPFIEPDYNCFSSESNNVREFFVSSSYRNMLTDFYEKQCAINKIAESCIPINAKVNAIKYLNSDSEDDKVKYLSAAIYNYFDSQKIMDIAIDAENIDKWKNIVTEQLNLDKEICSENDIDLITAMILKEHIARNREYEPIYMNYMELLGKKTVQ